MIKSLCFVGKSVADRQTVAVAKPSVRCGKTMQQRIGSWHETDFWRNAKKTCGALNFTPPTATGVRASEESGDHQHRRSGKHYFGLSCGTNAQIDSSECCTSIKTIYRCIDTALEY